MNVGMSMPKNTMKTKKSILLFCVLLLTSCASENSSNGAGALPKAVAAADETAAIQTLRTIATAEAQLKNSRGSYGDIDALVQAGFLDQRFTGPAPNLRGYRFSITAGEAEFSVNADPQPADGTATAAGRHFYLDSSTNAVHFNLKQTASRNDPEL